MRILLIKPSSFGDIIHALPIAHALRHHSGVDALDWVIQTEWAGILEGNPDVDRVIRFPRKQPMLGFGFYRELCGEYYDWIIDLQGLLRSALVARLACGKKRVGMGDSREGARFFYDECVAISEVHAIKRYAQVLSHLGVSMGSMHFSLPCDMGMANEIGEPFIAVHPYSRWLTKSLSPQWVKELVSILKPWRVVIVGQGGGYSDCGALDLSGKTGFKSLNGILKKAAGVISSDSGPMHLAAAMNRPLVALFGPTSPEKTGPWNPLSKVVRADSPSCVPCHSRRCPYPQGHTCMDGISPDAVAQSLTELAGLSAVLK